MAERFDFQAAFTFVGEAELQRLITLLGQLADAQDRAGRSAGKSVGGASQFRGSMASMGKSAQTASDRLFGVGTAAKATGTALEQAGAKGEAAANTMLVSWRSIRRVITGVIIARALGKLSAAFTKAAADSQKFQRRIEEIRAIQGQATKSANAWSDALKEVSRSTGINAIEVAEAAYQALSNQVANAANVTGFLQDAVIKLARVTSADLVTSVSAVSAILNSYSLDVSHAEKVSAALFATVEQGRLRLGDIADSIGNVTIVSNQLGISFEEVLGSIATLTRQGTSAANAQTFLRNAMLALIKPSKEMKEALLEMGFASGDAATKQLGLLRTLELLSKKAAGSNSELAAMAKFFGRIRGLIGATGLTADFDKTAGIIGRVSDALQDFRDRTDEVNASTFVELQKQSNRVALGFLGMAEGFRNFLALINQPFGAEFLSLTNALKAVTLALGGSLIFAAFAAIKAIGGVKLAFAAMGNSAFLAFFGGPQAIIFGIAFAVGALIGLALKIGDTARAFDDMGTRGDKAAAEVGLAWSDTAEKILKNVEQSTSGVVSAFSAMVNRIENRLKALNTAISDSQSALDLLISGTTNKADKANLLRLSRDEAKGLAQTALDTGNFKAFQEQITRATTAILALKELGDQPIDVFIGLDENDVAQFERRFKSSEREFKAEIEITRQMKEQSFLKRKGIELSLGNQRVQIDQLATAKKLEGSAIKHLDTLKKSIDKAQELIAANKLAQSRVKSVGDALEDFVDDNTGLFTSFATRFNISALESGVAFQQAGFAKVRDQLIVIEEKTKEVIALKKQFLEEGGDQITPENAEILAQKGAELSALVTAVAAAGSTIPPDFGANINLFVNGAEALARVDTAALNEATKTMAALAIEEDRFAQTILKMTDAFLESGTAAGVLAEQTTIANAAMDGQLVKMAASIKGFVDQIQALQIAAENLAAIELVGGGLVPSRVAGGLARRYASGGSLAGIGVDQRTASFADGEFISNQASSAEFLPQLIAMNSGASSQRREAGGNVTTSVGDINLTIQGGETAEATVRQIGQELQREIRRGNLRLN